jgi:hypothetical protein
VSPRAQNLQLRWQLFFIHVGFTCKPAPDSQHRQNCPKLRAARHASPWAASTLLPLVSC